MDAPPQIAALLRTIAERNRQLPPLEAGERQRVQNLFQRDSGAVASPLQPIGGETHVLVGAAGVGKSTCIGKWLAQAVLGEGRAAAVWRLDGRTANTAEALSLYAEVLNVPVYRSWSGHEPAAAAALKLVDLPGVDWQDTGALRDLQQQLAVFTTPRIHLVLNAAYEVKLLLAQAHAFALLQIADLVFTHLDEDSRLAKLQAVAVGTNYSVGYVSAGQNVPGYWHTGAAAGLAALPPANDNPQDTELVTPCAGTYVAALRSVRQGIPANGVAYGNGKPPAESML